MPPRRHLLVLALVAAVVLYAYRGSHSDRSLSSSDPTSSLSSSSSGRRALARSAPSAGRPTKLVVSMAGYSQFENLYLRNGTVYLLSPKSAATPYDPVQGGGGGFTDVAGRELLPIKCITSTGAPAGDPYELRRATETDIRVLAWQDRAILELDENRPLTIDGTTIWLNDSGKLFLAHYYHLWLELLMGAWKSLVLGSDNSEDRLGHTNVVTPSRMMFPHATEMQWRDKAGINGYLLKSIFPSLAYEHSSDWLERIATGKTYVFDRVVIVDRTAGSSGSTAFGPVKRYHKMMGDVFDADASAQWFQPIRQRLLATLTDFDPPTVPTITYISRQGHGRSLRESDHVALVAALESLVARKGWVLETPKMQFMTKDEQFALAARTTVMLGVHGNGLSHQLWMDPTPFSTVIEIFDQDAMVYDYALPSSALGHRHFTVWPTEAIDTQAMMRTPKYTPGFHGKDIRASAPLIVDLIEKRLEGWKPSQ